MYHRDRLRLCRRVAKSPIGLFADRLLLLSVRP
jgi:hypothetical protein